MSLCISPSPTLPRCSVPADSWDGKQWGKEYGGNLARLKLAPSGYRRGGGWVGDEKTGRAGKKTQEYHFSVWQVGLCSVHEDREKVWAQTAGGIRDARTKIEVSTAESNLMVEAHNPCSPASTETPQHWKLRKLILFQKNTLPSFFFFSSLMYFCSIYVSGALLS